MTTVLRAGLIVLGIVGATALPSVADARQLEPGEVARPWETSVTIARVLMESDPWSPSSELREMRVVRRQRRALDPWTDAAHKEPSSDLAALSSQLDEADPWTAPKPRADNRPAPESAKPTETEASSPQQAADDALRQAIKAAVDAGDLERAQKLIEVLRATAKPDR